MNTPISAFPNFRSCQPPGDNLPRMVCAECDWVHYENPRVVLTGFCLWQKQILLCRRAIPPRYGFWTLPGGFMELGETMEEGTCREVREEANAEISIRALLATYTVARIGQVHMVYMADLTKPEYSPGPESLEVRLFPLTESELPWDDLAFPVNHWILRDYLSLNNAPLTQPFSTRPEHRGQRMSPIPFHPDFPPPEPTSASPES
ncbi:MAG: NUDIX domain-containing protein [Fuerstiella sp.]